VAGPATRAVPARRPIAYSAARYPAPGLRSPRLSQQGLAGYGLQAGKSAQGGARAGPLAWMAVS